MMALMATFPLPLSVNRVSEGTLTSAGLAVRSSELIMPLVMFSKLEHRYLVAVGQ